MMETTDPISEATPFPSLSRVKEAHSALRSRFAAAEDKESLADEIESFIARGRATGVLLDEPEDRWSCQTLLDYWMTTLFGFGREPDASLLEFDIEKAPHLDDDLCPYVGLDAFREEDADRFVGRREFIEELVQKLSEANIVMVTGSSGSGKSSLVLAGLIPRLKRGEGGADWCYCDPMVPGRQPRAELEARVASSCGDSCDTPTIPRVIVIDQFEEIFTLLSDNIEEREAFADELVKLADGGDRIILTMRNDFIARLGDLPALESRLQGCSFPLRPLGSEDLRMAIEDPAEQIGLKFDKEVVDLLVNELAGSPAGLPLLQFSLLKLWEKRNHNRIEYEAYRQLGGALNALQNSADKLYGGFLPEEQIVTEQIFLKLVKLEGNEFMRDRVPIDSLYRGVQDTGRVDHVLGRLVDAHLLHITKGEGEAPDKVEVAHEALLRNWRTLNEWLVKRKEVLKERAKLTAEAAAWQRAGKDRAFLYRGDQLRDAESLVRKHELDADLTDEERAFLQASKKLRKEKKAAARRRQIEKLREERRKKIILWRWLMAVSALAVAMLIATVVAVNKSELAKKQTKIAVRKTEVAREQRIIADKQKNRAVKMMDAKPWLDNGIREDELGRRFEADLLTAKFIDVFPPENQGRSRDLLNQTGIFPVWQSPLMRHHDQGIEKIARSRDGKYLATAGKEGDVKVWNLETREIVSWEQEQKSESGGGEDEETIRVDALRGHDRGINALAFNAAGNLLASAGAEDRTIRVWDLATGKLYCEPLRGNMADLHGLAFGAGNFADLLASIDRKGSVRLWTVMEGRATSTDRVDFKGLAFAVAFSPDGTRLAVGGRAKRSSKRKDGTTSSIRIWDVDDILSREDREGSEILSPERIVTALAFRPLAAAEPELYASDSKGEIWANQLGEGEGEAGELQKLGLHSGGGIQSLAFDSKGEWLASAARAITKEGETIDGSIKLWKITDQGGQSEPDSKVMLGHRGNLAGAVFSGDALLSGGADGLIKSWDISTGKETESELSGRQAPTGAVAMSPDGRILAAGGRDGDIDLWDLGGRDEGNAAPSKTSLPRAHPGGVTRLAFDPVSNVLASGGIDGTVKLWDLSSTDSGLAPVLMPTQDATAAEVLDLLFDPDGGHLTAAPADRPIRRWNCATRERVAQEIWDPIKSVCIAIRPDGKQLAYGDAAQIVIVDLADGEEIKRLDGDGVLITSLAYSPDGTQIASGAEVYEGSEDKSTILWNIGTGARMLAFADGAVLKQVSENQALTVSAIEISPDGRLLACAVGRTVKLWSLEPVDRPGGRLRRDPLAVLSGYSVNVTDVVFSPDGRSVIAAGVDGSLRLWVVGADRSMRLTGHDYAFGLDINSESGVLAAGCGAGVRLWDLENGGSVGDVFPPPNTKGNAGRTHSVAFRGDSGTDWVAAAVAEIDGKDVPKLILSSGDEHRLIDAGPNWVGKPGEGWVGCVASAIHQPSGKEIIASGGDDGEVRLWDGETGAPLGVLGRGAPDDPERVGHKDRVTSLSFDVSGQKLASASKDGTVRLWQISGSSGTALGEPFGTVGGLPIRCVAFDPNDPAGRRLAWAGGSPDGRGYKLTIRDLDSKGKPAIQEFPSETEIWTISFHPSKNYIASGGDSFQIRIWDLGDEKQEGREVRWIDEFDHRVHGLSFSPDGRFLAASSVEESEPILVWNFDSLLAPEYALYSDPNPRWLELDYLNNGVRWNGSTTSFDDPVRFNFVNVRLGSHIGTLRSDHFDTEWLRLEALFGQYLYARNWSGAFAVYRNLEQLDQNRAQAMRQSLRSQLGEVSQSETTSSASVILERLESE